MGVSTSTAVFIGRSGRGPLDTPVLCLNFSDFERTFSPDYTASDMARSVQLFFQNGGTKCYIMRIAKGATYSEVILKNEQTEDVLKATAKSPGLTGDTIRLAVTYNGLNPESTFNLEVFRWTQNGSGAQVKTGTEKWSALSMDPDSPRYAPVYVTQNSQLIALENLVDYSTVTLDPGYSLSGRPVSNTAADFWETWRTTLAGLNTPVMGTPWGGTSTVNPSGTYTGAAERTFTFTVNTAGTNTVGSDAIDIGWDNGAGNTGTINLPATYVAGTPIAFSDGLSVNFGAGDLIGGEEFTVQASPTRNRFRIGVDGGAPVDVSLSSLNFDTDTTLNSTNALTNLHNKIQTIINDALPVGVSVTVTSEAGPDGNMTMLKIESANGDVRIEPAAANDLAVPMMLGAAQGGIEVSRFARYRPAPNGIVFFPQNDFNNLLTFAGYQQNAFNKITIDSVEIDLGTSLNVTLGPTDKMYRDAYTPSVTGNSDGVREKLGIIADKINEKNALDPTFKWTAQVWGYRLALIPGEGNDNSQGTITSSGGTDIAPLFLTNVRYYSLGPLGKGSFQTPAAAAASDGSAPDLRNYRSAFDVLDKEVDLFNLMVLPRDEDHRESETRDLWGPASVFCRKRRAFLLIDAPPWPTVQDAVRPTTGVNSLRVGLEKDYSAIFYPRITIRENGINKNIGASGAVAGLIARIDANRGVWKAPAGTEAVLTGVVGLEYRLSDEENGILNPRGINALRVFPNGIVNWGARTMDGDDDFASEYKYIPVRRLALFIEESLYRGTKWVVFEPNDEPLWAQIRLNVGAFMHNLFRQGAFQGTTPNDAYLVKCDKETTTQDDINRGIVNILVGFAPLKPAEFVIISIQQMAGQIVS
jgi:hypothetical protein